MPAATDLLTLFLAHAKVAAPFNRSCFMIKTKLLCGVVLAASPFVAPAKDFPLEFKVLTAPEAFSLPGNPGVSSRLELDKPRAITREPPAVSKHPLYGQFSDLTNRLCFRIDESKGDGKSYDRLIADLNQNGDLTDDPVITRVEQPAPRTTPDSEQSAFGPILVPEGKKIGSWQPIYFVQLNLYNLPIKDRARERSSYLGQLRVRAGWYLETTVAMDGITRKIGLTDGNCNVRPGDPVLPTIYKNADETNWYFQGGDSFLVDNDGSGKFQSSRGNSESAPFGPVLYLGAKLYKAAVAADSKTLALEPWIEPLAELALQPHGDQVRGIQVAWETAPGQWQLLQPNVENGKAPVPPGNYRLYTCSLETRTAAGDTLMLGGNKSAPRDDIRAAAGAPTPFKCGAPLEVKVSSERDTRNMGMVNPASDSFLGRLFGSRDRPETARQQRIQAYVIGAGGEQYSWFNLKKADGKTSEPARPTYAIAAADGKAVESGNMEFG
jgi:hypothetical protein